MVCGDSLPDLFAIAGQKMYFCNSNFSFMENYIKKAADAFLVERPYGMRVDYRKTSNPQLSSSASFLRLNVLSSLN